MMGVGFFSLAAGALELVVPSYALRLVRRFGAHRVGWFLVTAFASLALLHLLGPGEPASAGRASETRLNLIVAVASTLLLIGMSHLETLLSERQQAAAQKQKLKRELELQVQRRTADLASDNAGLQEELARRAKQEQTLKESEAYYRMLFTDHPQPMYIVDKSSDCFLAVNQAALRLYGFSREEFRQLTARELAVADDEIRVLQDNAETCAGVETRRIWRHRKKDLELMDVDMAALDVRFEGSPATLLIVNDVSNLRRHDLQLRHAERTETIGRLADGFAHHFDRFLSIIDSQANLLLCEPQDPATVEPLRQITAATNCAAEITRQLLAVGGRQDCHPEPLDINLQIQKLSSTFYRLVGQQVVLKGALGPNLPVIWADALIIEQILTNLILNARDAMRAGGTVTIHTSTVSVDERAARRNPEAKPGTFLRLAVRDTGSGIDPEIQPHLFEPFFTTRNGEGAIGLGLASVWGAVKQSSGWIEFTTKPGLGTEFAVFLPCSAVPDTSVRAEPLVPRPLKRGTILLVETDEKARGLARYVLSSHGYHVVEADSADTALVLWEGQASQIDLLFTEARLVGLSGRELAERLRQTRPDLKVVYSSCCSAGAEEPDLAPAESFEFIPKPYTPNQLLHAVQDAWQRTAAKPPAK